MSARPRRVALDEASWIDIYESWLEEPRAREIYRQLCADFSFERRSIQLFGKSVPQPRGIAWSGDRPYTYSRDQLGVRPWSPLLQELRESISGLADTPFNHALLNHYLDGQDSMGAHSDDEVELGEDPVIASLSLGATRRFTVRPKRGVEGRKLALDLASGDLLVMGGSMQARYKHALPKVKRVDGPRLNVTFRFVRDVTA